MTVATLANGPSTSRGLNWVNNGPVKFHSVLCGIRTDDTALDVFEEFLTAEKPELDKETAVAESVWRNGSRGLETKALNGRQGRSQA